MVDLPGKLRAPVILAFQLTQPVADIAGDYLACMLVITAPVTLLRGQALLVCLFQHQREETAAAQQAKQPVTHGTHDPVCTRKPVQQGDQSNHEDTE